MRKPEKAKPVRLVKDDGKIHLTPAGRPAISNGVNKPGNRLSLCGKKAMLGLLAGLPTAQPAEQRCLKCYAAVDAYGYPRELA
jgi:hypothetical protein